MVGQTTGQERLPEVTTAICVHIVDSAVGISDLAQVRFAVTVAIWVLL